MITPNRLFWIRLRNNARQQRRAWSSVMDWTVWLYILIPAIVIFGGLYRDLWRDMPEWAKAVPWTTLYPIVMFIVLLLGRIRIFVEEADRVFLLQKQEWLHTLKRWGVVYTLVARVLPLLMIYAVLLPFLVQVEELSLLQISLAFLYTLAVAMLMSASIYLIGNRCRGWLKWTVEVLALLVFAAIYLIPMMTGAYDTKLLGMAIAAGSAAGIVLLRFVDQTPIHLEQEVKKENETRLRSTELLMSQVIESKPLVRFKRPFLFRRSQRIFKASNAGSVLAEMRLKAFLRGMTHIRVWLSFISVSTYAISLVPGPVAVFLLAALTMLGSSWLSLQWKQWFAEPFISQFPWPPSEIRRGIRLSRFWLMLAPVVIWLAIAVYKLMNLLIS